MVQTVTSHDDPELGAARLKAQAKDLKLWSDRLQQRMNLQKQLEANLPEVELQVSELLSDPKTNQLSARVLVEILKPLCEAVFFANHETSKTGSMRAMQNLLHYCNNPAQQKQRLDRIAEVD